MLTTPVASGKCMAAGENDNTRLREVYLWSGLTDFLARVMGKAALYPMDDPLACANVMGYYRDEGLNWHFDRSEFTTTLLLQAPRQGGELQYRQELRSDCDPNLDGISRLLRGEDNEVATLRLAAGNLNVFKGKNTVHRVTPLVGNVRYQLKTPYRESLPHGLGPAHGAGSCRYVEPQYRRDCRVAQA